MSTTKRVSGASSGAVVAVKTDLLKSKLNNVYKKTHGERAKSISHEGLFEYLWDLKEAALMEGKQSIDLPTTWLEDLESEMDDSSVRPSH